MHVHRTSLPEVLIIEREVFEDERGFFMEVYRADQFAEHAGLGLPDGFVQVNHSRSARGVARGLHFQWDPPVGKLMRGHRGRGVPGGGGHPARLAHAGTLRVDRRQRREQAADVGAGVVRARLLHALRSSPRWSTSPPASTTRPPNPACAGTTRTSASTGPSGSPSCRPRTSRRSRCRSGWHARRRRPSATGRSRPRARPGNSHTRSSAWPSTAESDDLRSYHPSF